MATPVVPKGPGFKFPLQSPSPPGTTLGPSRQRAPFGDIHTPELVTSADAPAPRFRKTSSIGYHSSGIRESLDRSAQRASKSFIIVIPPPYFSQEHGQLGHTLSLGPDSRLSQGILMPLFSNMHAQLTAIAREFNFPSTTGLCLYLHISEREFPATPRISDEVWQFIWNPVMDASASHKFPIYGKVEFDVDRRRAPWYPSWISSNFKEGLRIPELEVLGGSYLHAHRDSRTSLADDHETDDVFSSRVSHSAIPPPASRHVPRKLSLLDRFDHLPGSLNSRPASRPSLSPPDDGRSENHALSTIVQLDEPKSAKHDLETRVKSWRASATHQEIETHDPLEAIEHPRDTIAPLDLDDFQWSPSSNGPNDYDPTSPLSWAYDPSIHLANRLEGSVDLTASDATSFFNGSPLNSPASSYYRLPSPDLAQRMYEDIPLTPSTTTSWGPLSLPSPTLSNYYLPSPDIAHRMYEDVPLTPFTATSWGPPLSYPPSPSSSSIALSIDIGERNVYSRPVTPGHCLECNEPQAGYHAESLSWGYVWPYYTPVTGVSSATQAPTYTSKPQEAVYPTFDIYRALYPFFSIYPSIAGEVAYPSAHEYSYSASGILEADPAVVGMTNHLLPTGLSDRDKCPPSVDSQYPNFNLYPVPDPRGHSEQLQRVIISSTRYPHTDPYPPVYPNFSLYGSPTPCEDLKMSGHIFSDGSRSQLSPDPAKVAVIYPLFNLYPAVYPCVAPYGNFVEDAAPGRARQQGTKSSHRFTPHTPNLANYPIFNLYPAVYPHLTPYPPLHYAVSVRSSFELGKPHPGFTVHPNDYPSFDIYPAAYPLLDIYPTSEVYPTIKNPVPTVVGISGPMDYPNLSIYPPLYPYLDPYPQPAPVLDILSARRVASQTKSTVSMVPAQYPKFNIYPPLDPRFDPHSELTLAVGAPEPISRTATDVGTRSQGPQDLVQYPIFNIYPSLYPHFNIYPRLVECEEQWKVIKIPRSCQYPTFHLYPAIYPHFDIWPPTQPLGILPPRKTTPNIKVEPFNTNSKFVELDIQKSPPSLESAHPRAPIRRVGRTRSSSIFQSRGLALPSPPKSPGTLRKLPTPPGSDSRPSSAFEIMSNLMANNETSPHIRSPSPSSSIVPWTQPQVDRPSPPAIRKRDSLVLQKVTNRHSLDARIAPREPVIRPPLPPIPKGVITTIYHKG